jgi:hypothetical protein
MKSNSPDTILLIALPATSAGICYPPCERAPSGPMPHLSTGSACPDGVTPGPEVVAGDLPDAGHDPGQGLKEFRNPSAVKTMTTRLHLLLSSPMSRTLRMIVRAVHE